LPCEFVDKAELFHFNTKKHLPSVADAQTVHKDFGRFIAQHTLSLSL